MTTFLGMVALSVVITLAVLEILGRWIGDKNPSAVESLLSQFVAVVVEGDDDDQIHEAIEKWAQMEDDRWRRRASDEIDSLIRSTGCVPPRDTQSNRRGER